jgi:ethanolamine utilization protein EutN
MLLGRVVGTVVPAMITEGLEGVPLLVVQPLGMDAQPKGPILVCADSTRTAGPGDIVAYEGGREAALMLTPSFVPVDGAIAGIVDDVHVPRAHTPAPAPKRKRGARR